MSGWAECGMSWWRAPASLRQRLDLITGGMLVIVAIGGCLSLELARGQWRDAKLLQALHEQQQQLEATVRLAEDVVSQQRRHQPVEAASLARIRAGLERLSQVQAALRDGGVVPLGGQSLLRVAAIREELLVRHLEAIRDALQRYRQRFERVTARQDGEDAVAGFAREQDLLRIGEALRIFLDGLAAGVESRAVTTVMRASVVQLAVMFGGIGLFLLSVLLHRRLVVAPLQRMAAEIAAMQQTGRLTTLPGMFHGELGVLASGFNQLAAQVEEQQRRLREQIVELERLNVEFAQMATLKDDFLATINHQLRTPVTAIVECIELMRDGALGTLTEEQRGFAQVMHENAMRLVSLVEQALDLSLLKSGRRPLQRRPGNLLALLRECQASWQEGAAAPCAIRLSAGELPPIYMDAQAIEEVMDHLLRNALRHAPKPSEILIDARIHHGQAEVAVTDHGPGLSDHQIERLFQPFIHLHQPEAPGSQGSGLGLAFCRQVIERHHGVIRASSSEGQGTTVTFSLPLASKQFLFEEACRVAQEEAVHEHGQFGVLVAIPLQTEESASLVKEMMHRVEAALRRHTHRGDRFVEVDECSFAVVAVTDQNGLEAMSQRLSGVLQQYRFDRVALTHALYPLDGQDPARLLQVAMNRCPEPYQVSGQGMERGEAATASRPLGEPLGERQPEGGDDGDAA